MNALSQIFSNFMDDGGRTFACISIYSIIRNFVVGYNSIVDDVVKTMDILAKICICLLNVFF